MNEKLSALMDGDLDNQSVRLMVDRLNREDSLKKDWDVYCLIGDVIRGDQQGAPDMVARVMSGLDDEPTVLAPRPMPAEASRRAVWHSLMPIAASVMGVAAVGLVAATMYTGDAGIAPVAAVPRVVTMAPVQNVSVTVPASVETRHREYLFVHQASTGAGPMPSALQYVRTVSAQSEESSR